MARKLKFGALIPDWIPGFSSHVIYKGTYTFVQFLAEVARERGDMDVFRVHDASQLDQCDALFTLHHTHTGWTQYDARTYTIPYLELYRTLEKRRFCKFLWNVEAVPYFQHAHSRKFIEQADVILYSSVCHHLFHDSHGALKAEFFYVGNPCTLDAPKKKYPNAISAPMTIDPNQRMLMATGVLNDKYQIQGTRLELLVSNYAGLPVEVHCYGKGWHANREKLPSNFRVMPLTMDGGAYAPYKYVLEYAESDRRDWFNSIGWHSDRLGFALSGSAHLVTDIQWSSFAYESVRRHEWLLDHIKTTGKLPEYNAHDIDIDRGQYNYKAVVERLYDKIVRKIQGHVR